MNSAAPLVAKTYLPAPDRPDTAALLAALDRATLKAMDEAGALAVECQRVLAKTSDNVVGELLRGSETFYEWNHYPKGDVFDRETNAQYFYHAHPQEFRGGEHGHFHTFMRPKGMPKGILPARVPNFVAPKGVNDALSHLIAISMDKFGQPIRLFTTNRWVTGEVWYAADDVIRMLDAFEIDHAQPSWPTNRWVGSVLRLFRPQIKRLLAQRDDCVATWVADNPESDDVYEDRRLEITSYVDVTIGDQRAAVERALKAA